MNERMNGTVRNYLQGTDVGMKDVFLHVTTYITTGEKSAFSVLTQRSKGIWIYLLSDPLYSNQLARIRERAPRYEKYEKYGGVVGTGEAWQQDADIFALYE